MGTQCETRLSVRRHATRRHVKGALMLMELDANNQPVRKYIWEPCP